MKKSLGILESYVLPHLVVDRIESHASGQSIELHGRGRTLEIGVVGDCQVAADLLSRLKNPKDEIWHSLHSPSNEDLRQTLELLDRYGWIEDSDCEGKDSLQDAILAFNKVVEEASDWVTNALAEIARLHSHEHKLNLFQSWILYIANDANMLISEFEASKRSIATLSKLLDSKYDSIQSRALMLSLRAWQRSSPKALLAFTQALNLSIKTFSTKVTEPLSANVNIPTLSGVEDIDAIRNQVWTACCLLVQSLSQVQAPRWRKFIPEQMDSESGINTVIQAEAAAELLIDSLGNTELFEVINNKVLAQRCGASVFLHQHFITIRYLESILSFLQYRMQKPLRAVGFEYLLEEIGHDVHEREACVRLGLSDEEISSFAPLPLFEVYADIIAYFAEVNPLSFCLSVIIAEGLPGQKKLITDALAAQGLDDPELAVHTELDLNLNHSYYPRKMMQSLRYINGKDRLDAMQNFLFILELSQLGWTQLARYAANEELQTVPKAFQIAPKHIINL